MLGTLGKVKLPTLTPKSDYGGRQLLEAVMEGSPLKTCSRGAAGSILSKHMQYRHITPSSDCIDAMEAI